MQSVILFYFILFISKRRGFVVFQLKRIKFKPGGCGGRVVLHGGTRNQRWNTLGAGTAVVNSPPPLPPIVSHGHTSPGAPQRDGEDRACVCTHACAQTRNTHGHAGKQFYQELRKNFTEEPVQLGHRVQQLPAHHFVQAAVEKQRTS